MSTATELAESYEVIIVGGRPAGAGLAARLGARGKRVLILDRAEFPSLPAVPSNPVVYPAAMALLDEIGVPESAYAGGGARFHSFVIEFGKYFDSRFEMPVSRGRDYVYGIDRASFDHALWRNLERFPSVAARAGVAFTDLVRDESGRVIGIEARAGDEPARRILADTVVGADGRFSAVARKAGAKVLEDFPDRTSTVYYADWEGAEPFDAGSEPVAFIHATGRGLDILHFPMPGGRTNIATHHRSDRADVSGDAEAYYEGLLRSIPSVRRRLEGARRVTPVVGMKRVANRYLEFGGPGWVLLGDALHHKDPVDGQGIYDALVEGKILDEALASGRSFDGTLELYRERVLAETRGMFLATMDRLKRELYEEPPEIVIRTLIRWMLTDPEYQLRFLRFLCRDISPEGWLSPSLLRGAALRGALGDLRRLARRVRGREDLPTAEPALRPE